MSYPFIVFEGIDGSGTTTQAGMLKDYFNKRGLKATVTTEPSRGPIGQLIKSAMGHRTLFTDNERDFNMQMAYLFAADRHDHLYNTVDGVLKTLEDRIVISTRYFFSSFAYQCSNDEDFDYIKKLNDKFPNPDLLVYIDNPVEVSLMRLSLRTAQEKYENKEKLTLAKENYEKILKDYNSPFLRIDGFKSPHSIHHDIVSFIEKHLLIKNTI